MYCNLLSTIKNFLNFSPLPELMQGAAVAVLTLLISFAIGIFIHHLGDGERKGNFLDLHVALDFVWFFKPSLIILAIAVGSPFLLSINNTAFKGIIFVVWLLSIIALFWILLRLYTWVKGDKDTFRLNYLSRFPKSSRDKTISWKDYWTTKVGAESRFNEKDFFTSFSTQVDEILNNEKSKDWAILPKLLDDFFSNIENRNKIFLLVFPEFFPKILEWDFILWKKQFSKFAKDKEEQRETQVDVNVFETENIISQIINYVTKEALSGKTGNAFSYFKHLEEHISKHESEHIVGSKHTYNYIEHINIYNDCFNLIPKSPESYDIWGHYFPAKWKITIDNLKNHIAARVWLHRFLDWSRSRVWNEQKEWDKDLDEVSKELFPSVDPIVWAKILAFVMRPWSGSRIQSIVEKSQNFGYVGRIFTGWGDIEKDFSNLLKEQLKNTVDLTIFIFGGVFTLENLNLWLSEIDNLNYPTDSDENKRKEHWKEILSIIKSRKEENSTQIS